MTQTFFSTSTGTAAVRQLNNILPWELLCCAKSIKRDWTIRSAKHDYQSYIRPPFTQGCCHTATLAGVSIDWLTCASTSVLTQHTQPCFKAEMINGHFYSAKQLTSLQKFDKKSNVLHNCKLIACPLPSSQKSTQVSQHLKRTPSTKRI